MVCRYGMSEAFGPINLSGKQNQIFLGRDLNNENSASSESVSRQVDDEVKMILQNQYERAMKILTDDREKLELFAAELVEAESLDDADLDRILGLSMRDQLNPKKDESPDSEATEETIGSQKLEEDAQG